MKTKNTIGPAELISEAVHSITAKLTEVLTSVVLHAEKTTERAEAIKVPARRKAKAKPKAKLHPHAHNGVKLTAWQWTVWVAVKALFDAKEELTKDSEGFYSLSGQFVAQFIGTPSNRQEQCRINAAMSDLKKKGLLVWSTIEVGQRRIKIKSGIAFGPNA